MVYNKMVKVDFDSECCELLDDQSRTLNWTYNKLLTVWKEDYANGNKHNFLSGWNLRNYMVNVLKPENPFLHKTFAHVLQEVPKRLKKAYEKAINEGAGFPKYRSWSRKWFSSFMTVLQGGNLQAIPLNFPLVLQIRNTNPNGFLKYLGNYISREHYVNLFFSRKKRNSSSSIL